MCREHGVDSIDKSIIKIKSIPIRLDCFEVGPSSIAAHMLFGWDCDLQHNKTPMMGTDGTANGARTAVRILQCE